MGLFSSSDGKHADGKNDGKRTPGYIGRHTKDAQKARRELERETGKKFARGLLRDMGIDPDRVAKW